MQLLIWSALLMILGLCLIALEVFVPSGGILGVLSVMFLIGSVAIGFFAGPLAGFATLGVVVLAGPAMIAVALRVWPKTPMGRRILLDLPTADDVRPDNLHFRELKQLVGKIGVAHSVMLPSGTVEIDGRLIDAMSPGIAIEPGQWVRVIEVRGSRVLVQPISESDVTAATDALSNPLNQSIEAIGIEDFEDPHLLTPT